MTLEPQRKNIQAADCFSNTRTMAKRRATHIAIGSLV